MVLRQKAFTKIVRTGKMQNNKIASPRPTATTRIKNKMATKLAKNGAVQQQQATLKADQLELVGTQKEKVN